MEDCTIYIEPFLHLIKCSALLIHNDNNGSLDVLILLNYCLMSISFELHMHIQCDTRM